MNDPAAMAELRRVCGGDRSPRFPSVNDVMLAFKQAACEPIMVQPLPPLPRIADELARIREMISEVVRILSPITLVRIRDYFQQREVDSYGS